MYDVQNVSALSSKLEALSFFKEKPNMRIKKSYLYSPTPTLRIRAKTALIEILVYPIGLLNFVP